MNTDVCNINITEKKDEHFFLATVFWVLYVINAFLFSFSVKKSNDNLYAAYL